MEFPSGLVCDGGFFMLVLTFSSQAQLSARSMCIAVAAVCLVIMHYIIVIPNFQCFSFHTNGILHQELFQGSALHCIESHDIVVFKLKNKLQINKN